MTTEEKKEFVEELRKGITFAGQIGDYVINQSLFDWLNSKLQAKDKEIAEMDEQLQLYHTLITDLKAEIERLKGEPTKERIMNAVHKSLQWDDGEILGIDILDLEKKVKEALNTNDH